MFNILRGKVIKALFLDKQNINEGYQTTNASIESRNSTSRREQEQNLYSLQQSDIKAKRKRVSGKRMHTGEVCKRHEGFKDEDGLQLPRRNDGQIKIDDRRFKNIFDEPVHSTTKSIDHKIQLNLSKIINSAIPSIG